MRHESGTEFFCKELHTVAALARTLRYWRLLDIYSNHRRIDCIQDPDLSMLDQQDIDQLSNTALETPQVFRLSI